MDLEVKTAYDNQLIDTIPMHTERDIEQMLASAYELHRNADNHIPIERRCDILQKTQAKMQSNKESLALLIAKEGGKPLTDAKVEVDRAIDGMQLCIEYVRTRHGQSIPMDLNLASTNRMAMTKFEPIGVVVAISAFNHPLNLIVHQVAPAIAAGCPVIVKPASTTPLCAKTFVDYLHQSGCEPERCQLAILSGKDAEKLATDSRVAFLTFIGSANVGWMLRSKLAKGARCALEHGGIAPVIIDQSANLDNLLPKVIKGGYYHAGQVCVSVQRVYVHQSLLSSFTEQLVEGVKKLKTGDPTQEDTDVGPLIATKEVKRVHEWITEAIEQGADCPVGAKLLSDTTYAPTVLLNPPDNSKVLNEEVFGPAVMVVPFTHIDEALAKANSVPFSFQASIFSENITSALQAANKIQAAAVMINDHTAFRVDWMPFAGYQQSGHGVGGIPYTMDEMSQEKMVVLNYNV